MRLKMTLLILVFVMFSGCKSDETTLPTQVDISVLQTQTAEAAPLHTETPTPRSAAPTLPPTFTPQEIPSETPTPAPTETPIGYSASGTIYYIHDDTAIVALAGDGTQEERLFVADPGSILSELRVSPDGAWLAFVAPGVGSAREIWVMNRDASYVHRVSCLGFGEVQLPRWSLDSTRIAFAAAQASGGTFDIYEASSIRVPCSDETQKLLAKVGSNRFGDLIYAPFSDTLFFSTPVTYALNLTDGMISVPITPNTGFGADFLMAFHPRRSTLMTYLQATASTTHANGYLIGIDVAAHHGLLTPAFDMRSSTSHYEWRSDGNFILVSSVTSVYHYNWNTKTASNIVMSTMFPPQAVYSPDEQRIAYIDGVSASAAQIYTVGINGRNTQRLTNYAEGTIRDIVWLDGAW